MSRYIATRAIRGANALVSEAELMLNKALAEKGPDTPVSFPNTAYYLPLILGMTGEKVETLGQLQSVIQHARRLLHPLPSQTRWTPYLGETLDSGMATLLAAEIIEAVRFVYNLQPEPMPGFELAGGTSYSSNGDGLAGHLNGPIDDIQLRSWGIQLVDGRMPGFAAIVGAAKSNEVAVKLVRELQRRNILTFLSGNVNGRSIIHQLMEEGVELGYDTYTVPFGTDTMSAIYALGFATRSALTFGGLKPGQAREILLYNRERVFAFVLALGEVDDLKYAAAAGAINFGFPVIADTVIPEILPTGITTYEHVVSMPFNEIAARDDLERAERLVQKCIEVRGVKLRMAEVPVPVPYGSAFEGEVVRKTDMRVEFGGKYSRCFEYLHMAPLNEVVDGKVEVVGPDFSEIPDQGHMDMGILVKVAGRQMQEDFEPVLERQIHYFVNGASGIQHIGQRDIAWIRVSKAAADKGFDLEHFGKILHARFHADFGAIVDKVQVTIYTEPDQIQHWLDTARQAYDYRNKRLADLTDDKVDEFFSCTLCQSFAPNHVCIVSPERLGLCGAYNWLDCKASFSINPTGPNQPIKLGKLLDPIKGYWQGTIDYAKVGSHGVVEEVSMYSIMENPMTACLTSDAEVFVDGRPVKIGEWVETRLASEAPQPDSTENHLATMNEAGNTARSKLLGVHKNPAPKEMIHIRTKSGLELTLTPNHEVSVDRWDQNGHGPWVRADELRRGDRLYALKRLRMEGRVPAAADLLPDELSAMPLPEISPDLMYLLGLIASDGSFSWPGPKQCRINFTNSSDGLLDAFTEIYTRLFPRATLGRRSKTGGGEIDGRKISSTRSCSDLYSNNFVLGLIAEAFGVRMRGVEHWDLGRVVRLPEAHIAAFLAGVLDGDGSVRLRSSGPGWQSGEAYLCHSDRRAAQHLQLLLKRLGIVGNFRQDRTVYRVELFGRNAQAFAALVPSRHPEKRETLAKIAALPPKALNKTQEQVLPFPAGKFLANLPESSAVLPPSTLFYYKTGRSRPVADKVRAVIEEVPQALETLQPFLETDLFLDTITSVEVVPNDGRWDHVYNLSLLEINSYLANGIHVKNCGCFECIVMLVPEVNGVMVVSREDTSLTPAGMTFSTLAGMAGGGVQTPGVMGVGKFYLVSPKFISADGGFKRVVWMSSVLKETMSAEFQAVAERQGIPDLIDRIADERVVSDVAQLEKWVEEKQHPVLQMGPIGAEQPAEVEKAEAAPEAEVEPEAAEEEFLAQAEAIVEAAEARAASEARSKAEEKIEDEKPEEAEEQAEPEIKAGQPVQPKAPEARAAAPSDGKDRYVESDAPDRAERAVDILRRALIAALSELGGVDVKDLQIPAAPPAPPAVEGPPAVTPPVEAEAPAAPVVEEVKRAVLEADRPWIDEHTKTEILKEKWTGAVREVTLGATADQGGTRARTVTVGGETAMPFMHFEGSIPHSPAIAIEIRDRRPEDWSPLLMEAWGDVAGDPARWAQAAEKAGADLLLVSLSINGADGKPTTPDQAVKTVKSVLEASGLPLIVFGPGQAEADNQLLVPIAESFKGERLLLGLCEDKNYRTIVAAAMANGHLVNARTAMDVNLAKQLNILISDMGLPLDRIIMDPTTGALGYGFEYGYSVMERLRLAALQGDSMTQLPMLVTPGEEAWKTKESKVGEGVPEEWGDWKTRAITWETLTSVMLLESGADILVLRHPESVKRTRQAIEDLMDKEQNT